MFTRGSSDSIRFADRPMWLSVDSSGDGMTLTAEDATNEGQPIQLDAGWLADHGIDDHPIAHYTDGTPIPVSPSADGSAYVVDTPHFTKIEVTDPDLSTSWKEEGHTRQFLADGPNATGEFNITVSNVTVDVIEFRYWSAQNASSGHVFDGDEPFEKEGRESLERPGYYTLNYINETDLATGDAVLGDTQFELVEINLMLDTYDFSDGNLTYRFDQDHGYLEEVVDDRNGASITMQNVRNWGEEPTPATAQEEGRTVVWLVDDTPNDGTIERWAFTVTYENDTGTPDWQLETNWAGTDEHERTPGNILSTENSLRVKARIAVVAEVTDQSCEDSSTCSDESPCHKNGECHLRSLVNKANAEPSDSDSDNDHGWAVQFDQSDDDDIGSAFREGLVGNPDEHRAVCGECDFSSKHTSWYNSTLATLSFDGLEYQGNLLSTSYASFYACGRAQVWEGPGPTEGPEVLDKELCETPFDADVSAPFGRTGFIKVDPFLVLP